MKSKGPPIAHGIPLKKQYGQHFLRAQQYVDSMLAKGLLNSDSSVFEIGCGDGFLTRSIIAQPIKRLWVFEIDHEWAQYVKTTYSDPRMTMFEENILDADFTPFEQFKPWILLSNLPYQITFPILHLMKEQRHLLLHGIVMVQEEVAQKIVKTHGRGYGYISLYFQHFFEWQLLDKVPANAFFPPPKVQSRLLFFKPRATLDQIPHEEDFWIFIKRCFSQPRRILKNNLHSFHYDMSVVPEDILLLRAQQLTKQDFIALWSAINKE
jgi:16S rRNA (adenine1518-N6/adenine1519-N6)-dimethyltransferase